MQTDMGIPETHLLQVFSASGMVFSDNEKILMDGKKVGGEGCFIINYDLMSMGFTLVIVPFIDIGADFPPRYGK